MPLEGCEGWTTTGAGGGGVVTTGGVVFTVQAASESRLIAAATIARDIKPMLVSSNRGGTAEL